MTKVLRERIDYCTSLGLEVLAVRDGRGSHKVFTLAGPLGRRVLVVTGTDSSGPRAQRNMEAQARRLARQLGCDPVAKRKDTA